MTFLDVGCGAGALTALVAAAGVETLGVDVDPAFIARASESGLAFECRSAFDLAGLRRRFDVVYARYLLSHLPDPRAGLEAMIAVARPGGAIVVEDIDFDLHVAQPRPPAFIRYLELYRTVVERRGGNPFLGRHLFAMAQEAGLVEVEVGVQVTMPKHPIATLTLAGIRDALIREALATEAEIDALLAELSALEADPRAFVSVAGTYQVWGRTRK